MNSLYLPGLTPELIAKEFLVRLKCIFQVDEVDMLMLLVLLNCIGANRFHKILLRRYKRQKAFLSCLQWVQKAERQSCIEKGNVQYASILVEAKRRGLASFQSTHKLHLLLEKRLAVFRKGNSLFWGFVIRSIISIICLSFLLELVQSQFQLQKLQGRPEVWLLVLWAQVIMAVFLRKVEQSELEWHAEGTFSSVNWNWLRALFLGEVPDDGILSRYRDWQRKRQLGGAAQLKSLSDYTTMEAEKDLNTIENKLTSYQGLGGVLEFVIVLPGILLVSIQFLNRLGSEIWTDSLFF